MSYTTSAVDDAERNRLAYERSARPREYYAELRARGRIDSAENPEELVLVRRDDVEHALRTWQDYSSEFSGVMGSDEPLIPLNVDPPLHANYRKLLDPYFAPKKMAALQPTVQQHTNDLIDAFIGRGSCDFSTEMAVPLPCSTYLSLLGLPTDELDALVRWKDIMIRPEHVVADRDEALALQATTAGEIYGRFGEEVAARRTKPRDDLITYLVQAEIAGEKLTDSEILRTCFLLLAAGLDTVTISLECIFAYLVDHDDARAMLVREPGSEITLIEELLRWETPVQTVTRRATRDLEVEPGVVIPKDQTVLLALASADVDPEGVPGADEVDVRRGDIRAFAFGGGPHRCLGSNLARMELRTVVRTWHDRIPEYQLAPDTDLVWNGSTLRGVDHMPLTWQPA
ncbi:MAG: cytochrome P450 [Acidimicrobiia bacterium]